MTQFLVKILVSALLIAAVSEIGRRNSLVAALLASLPLTSILAFVWLYRETGDTAKIAALSTDIFWLVLPSLALFLLLPVLLRQGWGFWWSLLASCAATAVAYGGMLWGLRVMRG
jgi:hypothetical protein